MSRLKIMQHISIIYIGVNKNQGKVINNYIRIKRCLQFSVFIPVTF